MILVVGATGTVGRKVIEALLANPQIPIRALARGKNDWEASMLPSFRRRGVEVVVGDVRSESLAARAVKGCTAIINCSGLMRALPDADIESVNVDSVHNLINMGEEAGVQRFIQLSCMGATEHATCLYFGCKWDAEDLVRKSKFYWTIFRPSLIFDSESPLLRILDFWIERMPMQIVVGSGLNRFQPISATDVASCIASSVYDRDTVGKIFELPGPEKIDLQTLLTLVAEKRGKEIRSIRIPSFLGVPLAGLLGKMNPNCPIDSNVMKVLTSEMMADPKPMLQKFQFGERMTIEACLDESNRIGTRSGRHAAIADDEDGDESDADDEEDALDSKEEADDERQSASRKAKNKAGNPAKTANPTKSARSSAGTGKGSTSAEKKLSDAKAAADNAGKANRSVAPPSRSVGSKNPRPNKNDNSGAPPRSD
jgi:NADH dehydrogenase